MLIKMNGPHYKDRPEKDHTCILVHKNGPEWFQFRLAIPRLLLVGSIPLLTNERQDTKKNNRSHELMTHKRGFYMEQHKMIILCVSGFANFLVCYCFVQRHQLK